MHPSLESILPKVQKPARYTGGEFGEITKDKSEIEIRIALCFPDTYEIGNVQSGPSDPLWCTQQTARCLV